MTNQPAPQTLRPLAEGLWQVEGALRAPGGVRLPLQMTVIRLASGGLALHSPVPLRPSVGAEIAALGPVEHILCPNRFHHLHAGTALARWPTARLHGAPGLASKRPDLAFDSELGATPDAALAEVLDQAPVAGAPILNEIVWMHKPSRTLITTDLLFHLREPMPWQTRLVTRLTGTHDRLAQSQWWRFYTRDRAAFRSSLEVILAWKFEHATMAHGTPVAVDSAGMRQALWMMR